MTIKVGVIGAGILGGDHISHLYSAISGASVGYVADIDGDRAAATTAAQPPTPGG